MAMRALIWTLCLFVLPIIYKRERGGGVRVGCVCVCVCVCLYEFRKKNTNWSCAKARAQWSATREIMIVIIVSSMVSTPSGTFQTRRSRQHRALHLYLLVPWYWSLLLAGLGLLPVRMLALKMTLLSRLLPLAVVACLVMTALLPAWSQAPLRGRHQTILARCLLGGSMAIQVSWY